jgi:enoyl-CoA hydratase
MKVASYPQGLVLAERDGSVLRLTLNRPERLNAVSEALYAALLDYAAMAEDDRGIRCVLLTGAGRAFCAGADLKAHGTRERTGDELRAYVGLGQRVCARIQHLTVPVVAAVRGYALGAGAELAVSADFLVIADDAQMGFPEVSLGTFVGGGVTHRLPRLVGLRRATELLMLAQRFTGRQALEWGLAHAAPPDARLERTAGALAAQLAANAPLSVARLKRRLADTTSLGEAFHAEADDLLAVMGTADWAEGVAAFAARRTPVFQGR